jgi:hypothetical protein
MVACGNPLKAAKNNDGATQSRLMFKGYLSRCTSTTIRILVLLHKNDLKYQETEPRHTFSNRSMRITHYQATHHFYGRQVFTHYAGSE